MRPVIGITMAIDASRVARSDAERLLLRRSYAQAVARAGGTPVLLPPDADANDVAALCDGIVLSGGADLPTSFAKRDAPPASAEHADRVAWERRLLDGARTLGRPLLGVCYGMQLVNLHCGGTLLADIAAAVPAALDHGGAGRACEHEVVIAREALLFELLGPAADVCSRHHQAVASVAPGFRVVATAPDGVVEAIESEREAILGVEWHPEADATGAAIYGWLVRRAREHAERRRRPT
jgi:gamma-glutamyl-gamma-aminobutyrate hydrolase PuuD